MADLVTALRRERVMELDSSYGTPILDGELRVLDLWLDGVHKTLFFYSDLREERRKDDVRRALRMWIALRSVFELSGAVDTRVADQALIDHLR